MSKTNCFDAESVALYFENKLPDGEKSKYENHIINCKTCMDEFIMLSKKGDEALDEFPISEALIEKCLKSIPQKDIIKIVVDKAKIYIDRIKGTFQDLTQPLLDSASLAYGHFIRGEGEQIVRLNKILDDSSIMIEIKKSKKDLLLMNLFVSDRNTHKLLDNVEISLENGGIYKKIQYKNSPVIFDDILPQKYSVKIKNKNNMYDFMLDISRIATEVIENTEK